MDKPWYFVPIDSVSYSCNITLQGVVSWTTIQIIREMQISEGQIIRAILYSAQSDAHVYSRARIMWPLDNSQMLLNSHNFSCIFVRISRALLCCGPYFYFR